MLWLPGMRPERRPGHGSLTLPSKRSRVRASTTCSSLLLRLASSCCLLRTRLPSKVATYVALDDVTAPLSIGRPSATHFFRPPSSTRTSAWPNDRNIHHARGAATHDPESYSTTVSPLLTPSAPTSRPNCSAVGNMCGNELA